MKVITIEKIYTLLKKLSEKSPIPLRFRIGLFIHSISHIPTLVEDVKKHIPQEVIEFERSKSVILNMSDGEVKRLKLKELTDDIFTVDLYNKTLSELDVIYKTDIEIPKFSLSIDDIPDDLEDFSQEEIDLLFTLVD